jgi:YesN/AraC family two-component response regulator
MLTLETVIQKIQQLPPEQQKKVIEFVEFLEFQADRQQPETPPQQDQDFFALAGIWEGKNITLDTIRKDLSHNPQYLAEFGK